VNPYSVDDIANGLAILLTSEKTGNQGVDFEQFHWSKIAEKYLILYNDLHEDTTLLVDRRYKQLL